ncbi:MAG: hypothetical protein ABI267_05720, partial [Ginsengibacter sp.]
MIKILLNPFVKIAGYKALIYGWLLILITAVIAYFSHTHFDGAIDAHGGTKTLWWVYLLEPFIAWISVTIIFYLTGLIFSQSKIRFADVAGTLALARFPMFFTALLYFGPMPDIKALDKISFVTVLNIVCLTICGIWMIALFFNAYTVSCNPKKGKTVWTFILALIVAEIIS